MKKCCENLDLSKFESFGSTSAEEISKKCCVDSKCDCSEISIAFSTSAEEGNSEACCADGNCDCVPPTSSCCTTKDLK